MATLVRWEPFREMASLQNDMSRLLGAFFGQPEDAERAWVPSVDAWDTEGEVVYAFDLPGVSEEDISVELDEGSLTVSGKRERSEEVSNDRFYRFERRFGSFSRTVGLPQSVTEEDITAEYRDGVLEVSVKKPEAPKPRRIQVGSGEKATIEGTSQKA